jgi:hypothetical protein
MQSNHDRKGQSRSISKRILRRVRQLGPNESIEFTDERSGKGFVAVRNHSLFVVVGTQGTLETGEPGKLWTKKRRDYKLSWIVTAKETAHV